LTFLDEATTATIRAACIAVIADAAPPAAGHASSGPAERLADRYRG
jgi:hypothetical protein